MPKFVEKPTWWENALAEVPLENIRTPSDLIKEVAPILETSHKEGMRFMMKVIEDIVEREGKPAYWNRIHIYLCGIYDL